MNKYNYRSTQYYIYIYCVYIYILCIYIYCVYIYIHIYIYVCPFWVRYPLKAAVAIYPIKLWPCYWGLWWKRWLEWRSPWCLGGIFPDGKTRCCWLLYFMLLCWCNRLLWRDKEIKHQPELLQIWWVDETNGLQNVGCRYLVAPSKGMEMSSGLGDSSGRETNLENEHFEPKNGSGWKDDFPFQLD